jgi:hypothetical protein
LFSEEEERRSRDYDSLVRAQRRYAEKLSSPSGLHGRFTTQEWQTLGENFDIEEWEGGFLEPKYHRKNVNTKTGRGKENMPVTSAMWKGKEKAVEVDSDDDDPATVTMVF